MEMEVNAETLKYYIQMEEETGVPYKRLMCHDLDTRARERGEMDDLSELLPYGGIARGMKRQRYNEYGEYADYFEVRVVANENAIAHGGKCTLSQIMIEIERIAASNGLINRNDDRTHRNIVAYAIEQEDTTSYSKSTNLAARLCEERCLQDYLQAVIWYDSYEDETEDWLAYE